jgi:peptide/nickel transport system permease protein
MSEITLNAGAPVPAPERAQRMSAADEPTLHYVSPAPFDPYSVDVMTPEQERFYRASQWKLMWMRFRRHRVAGAAGALLLVF